MYRMLLVAALMVTISADNVTESDTCSVGPWGAALEEWAVTSAVSERHGRILSLPSSSGYYVTERMDGPLSPPPLPPPLQPPQPGRGYSEWQPPTQPQGPGKIVNRPTKPSKDKFKPSYEYKPDAQYQQSPPHYQQTPSQSYDPAPPSSHQQPSQPSHQQPSQPSHQLTHQPSQHYQQSSQHYQQSSQQYQPSRPQRPASDRVDEPPPHKMVSETDLYLLAAIEKLVYRADLMEKRMRKMEESVHYLIAGAEPKPEPCVANFTRVGGTCYHFSSEANDWKTANLACRKFRSNLLEIDSEEERNKLFSNMLSNKLNRGVDWWTGGLNPGLLWIWSHSARPVSGNTTTTTGTVNSTQNVTIVGEGRCLALIHDGATSNYVYRGQDCGLRHKYVCEKEEDKAKLSNEIERVARKLKSEGARKAKILWRDDE